MRADVVGVLALAEFAPQHSGLSPDAPELEPYFALAEELDIPVGLHVGIGAPGAAYRGGYRMAQGNPLLLEEVLVRHPDLRLYVMHAGWPFLDEMLGLLWTHPQVYVDIGVINWVLPRADSTSTSDGSWKRGLPIAYSSDRIRW